MPRPSGLTEELRRRLVRELDTGATLPVVCERTGVKPRTLERWLAEGRVVRHPPAPAPVIHHPALSLDARLERAEPGLLAAILAAAQRGHWQAAAWVLERQFPERWAKPASRPMAPDEADGTPDRLADIIDIARGRRPTADPDA